MKTRFFSLAAVCMALILCLSPLNVDALAARDEYGAALELVTDIATTQSFTDEAVDEADIEKILQSGINAPSAMNSQPWHFSLITDKDVLNQINEGMSFGGGMPPMGEMPGGNAPADMKMPEGMAAAAVLLIGYEDSSVDESIDGYTGASARNPLTDKVSYIMG